MFQDQTTSSIQDFCESSYNPVLQSLVSLVDELEKRLAAYEHTANLFGFWRDLHDMSRQELEE